MTRRACAVFAVALVSGCASEPLPPTYAWIPDEDGITVSDTGLEVGFGRAMSGALPAISSLVGADPATTARRGPCTVYRWPDGFEIHASEAAFVGWRDPQARSGQEQAGRLCPG